MNKKMVVCFVDDEFDAVEPVITELKLMKELFEVRHFKAYELVTDDVVDNVDLFVLDVWTTDEQTSTAFVRFVNRIAKRKPYFAFTTAIDKSQITLSSGGSKGLREFVLSKAGLGVVSKRDKFGDRWRYEFRLDVIQKILLFYWCRQN